MMIKITLENRENKATLEIPGEYVHPINISEIVNGCIDFVEKGGQLTLPGDQQEANSKSSAPKPPSEPIKKEKYPNIQGRPRQIQMLGERSPMPVLKDALAKAGLVSDREEDDDKRTDFKAKNETELKHQKQTMASNQFPSVREKNGTKVYQCYYWCQNSDCKNKGKHFISLDRKTVTCHSCGSVHKVRPATPNREIGPNGIPIQDNFNNYFRADELVDELETKQPVKSEAQEKKVKNNWNYRTARKMFVCENNDCNNDVLKGVGYYQKGKSKRICSLCKDKEI